VKPFLLAVLAATLAALSPIAFPGGEGGIGFDDLTFAPGIHRVLVPGGRTGKLMLIDPASQATTIVSGFSAATSYGGGHGEGITSADEGHGVIFVTDRSSRQLNVVDELSRQIIATTPLASGPDYVRFVDETNEVWVTEPRAHGIEVFSIKSKIEPLSGSPAGEGKGEGAAVLAHSGFIDVPGGPESLVIDHSRKRAYTNLWTDSSIAIDLAERKIVARWPNGCAGSRGLALDEQRGFLFAGCDEGRASVLSTTDGSRLGSASSGAGVDIIAYNRRLAHLYLPGGDGATMATIGIAADGAATVLGTVPTAHDSHCVTTDDRDQVYVCDPGPARILVFKDSLPISR
jgi:hypothetical protein